MRIRAAAPDEGERLREIAIAAKSHWGYDADRVRSWAADGDFSPAGLASRHVYVAQVADELVGWAAGLEREGTWWLDDLWIEPAWMGRGVGRLLFDAVAARGRALGATRMEWEAEPNAVGFYEKLGGRILREGEVGSWGRRTPIMGLDLRG